MTISCIVCNDTLEQNPSCELFPFPDKATQPVQYQKYLIVCDLSASTLPNDDQLYICSSHFTPDCFEESAGQRTLRDGTVPSLNLERIDYDDDDIQMLDEYIPLYNAEQHQTAVASTSGTSVQPIVETLLVPKSEPVDEVLEDIPFVATEVKTEAPEADETTPDPFGNIEPGPSSDPNRYCILCDAREGTDCRLYVFPRKIPNIYRKWILAAGLDFTQYKNRDIYSCQRHFPENGFFANGRLIQSWATPKLNLPVRKNQPAPSTAQKPTVARALQKSGNIKAIVSSQRVAVIPTDKSEELISSSNGEGPNIVIKYNAANRKNAEALNIDPDNYAKVFTKVVMDLVPKTLNYNGEQRPVNGTIVFSSNLF